MDTVCSPGGWSGGALLLLEENKNRWGLGSWGLGPVATSSMLTLSWALGHLPMPGSPRGDAPALQKCWNRHIWRVKKRFSQQRLFPASGSEPSITSQAAPEPRRAGLEAAQSPGQWSQARGGEDEGVGRWDRGAAGRPVSAVLQAGPWGSRE